jgi:hypothetical protein
MSAYHDEDEAEELSEDEDPDESDMDDDDSAPDEADWSDVPPRKSLLWIGIALLVIAAFVVWALHARQ